MWGAIATWAFAAEAVEKAAEILGAGGMAADAAEEGIKLVESNPLVESVGVGGFLNRDGELELDAAMMDGDSMQMGAVCAVKGFEHPIKIARAVMEKTRHSVLVGSGAERFAREMGIEEKGMEALITPTARALWEKNKTKGHDTIGMVTLDVNNKMVAATSTSGAGMKIPGRAGDSPMIGSGFYVESGVGGAAATGLGEDIMRTCCSFRAVEMMRGGMSPQEAAETVVRTAHETILRHGGKPDEIALVCMNEKGEFGGAANHTGFAYACASEIRKMDVVRVTPIIDKNK